MFGYRSAPAQTRVVGSGHLSRGRSEDPAVKDVELAELAVSLTHYSGTPIIGSINELCRVLLLPSTALNIPAWAKVSLDRSCTIFSVNTTHPKCICKKRNSCRVHLPVSTTPQVSDRARTRHLLPWTQNDGCQTASSRDCARTNAHNSCTALTAKPAAIEVIRCTGWRDKVSELEFIPAEIRMITQGRPKYSCHTCEHEDTSASIHIADEPPPSFPKAWQHQACWRISSATKCTTACRYTTRKECSAKPVLN